MYLHVVCNKSMKKTKWTSNNKPCMNQSIMIIPRTPVSLRTQLVMVDMCQQQEHSGLNPNGGAVKLLPGWAFGVCLSQAFPKVLEAVLNASICRNTLQWMMGCESKIIQNGYFKKKHGYMGCKNSTLNQVKLRVETSSEGTSTHPKTMSATMIQIKSWRKYMSNIYNKSMVPDRIIDFFSLINIPVF